MEATEERSTIDAEDGDAATSSAHAQGDATTSSAHPCPIDDAEGDPETSIPTIGRLSDPAERELEFLDSLR